MENAKRLHRKIVILSSISFAIGIVFLPFYLYNRNEDLLPAFLLISTLSVASIISSFILVNINSKKIKKAITYSLIFYPLIGLLIFLLTKAPDIFYITLIVFAILVITIFALSRLFLYDKPTSLKTFMVFLGLVFISLALKKIHLQGGATMILFNFIWLALGIYIFGVRCLYLIENNRYFRALSYFVCILITVTLTALLFKMMRWPINGILLDISNFLMIAGSFVVLISLPYAGYVDWPKLHKKILGKLLYPWIFIFLLFLFKYVAPNVWNTFWGMSTSISKKNPGFGMVDYSIEKRNGLE